MRLIFQLHQTGSAHFIQQRLMVLYTIDPFFQVILEGFRKCCAALSIVRSLAGLGGSIEVLGRYTTFLWKELPGYGWTGITIAILAKNNPIFVPFAAFFIAYLNKGCSLMATYSDVPAEMIDIIQAAIFLFFAAEQFLARYRQKIVVRNTQADLAKLETVKGGETQ